MAFPVVGGSRRGVLRGTAFAARVITWTTIGRGIGSALQDQARALRGQGTHAPAHSILTCASGSARRGVNVGRGGFGFGVRAGWGSRPSKVNGDAHVEPQGSHTPQARLSSDSPTGTRVGSIASARLHHERRAIPDGARTQPDARWRCLARRGAFWGAGKALVRVARTRRVRRGAARDTPGSASCSRAPRGHVGASSVDCSNCSLIQVKLADRVETPSSAASSSIVSSCQRCSPKTYSAARLSPPERNT